MQRMKVEYIDAGTTVLCGLLSSLSLALFDGICAKPHTTDAAHVLLRADRRGSQKRSVSGTVYDDRSSQIRALYVVQCTLV
jgi:hypothetical protein